MPSINKLNCTISYSVNAAEMTEKEFEIFCSPEKLLLKTQSQLAQQQHLNSAYFFIGHQEKKSDLNHLFSYDLGQVILSKGKPNLYLLVILNMFDSNIKIFRF